MQPRIPAAMASLAVAAASFGQSPAFTYQGRLKNGAQAASGLHDFRFRLFDAASGGVQVGTTQCVDNVPVAGGLFTTPIDFGPQFATGAPRFLEIEVRADSGLGCAATTGFVILSPRQPLTATPLASHAKSASALAASDGSPASAVFVDATGRVGIGTTTPASRLHVTGVDTGVLVDGPGIGAANASWMEFRDAAGTRTGYVGDGSQSDSSTYLVSDAGDVHLYTAVGAVLTATPSGRVGIGTTAPAAQLHVAGDARVGAFTATSINISSTTRSWTMHPFALTDLVPGEGGQYDLTVNGLSVVGVDNVFGGSVQLPDGATIIALEVLGHDGTTTLGADLIATLGRTNFAGDNLQMASVSSQLGGSVWQTTSIVAPIVDNDTHSYWVHVRLHGGFAPFDVTLRAIRIIYQISKPLP